MKYLYMALVFLIFLSCNKDVENITIQGVVKDVDTKEVIKNVDVIIVCWKYGNSPDESYTEDEEITTKTDGKGEYKFNFDKGAFIEVKVSVNGYIDGHETKEIYQKKNSIDILLKRK